MGLLDDAIREHLELKRRSGADASEVARQEQEALGPARRGPEPLELSRTPAAPAAEPEPDEPAPEPESEPEFDADVPEFEPQAQVVEEPPAWAPEPEAEPEREASPEPEPLYEAPPEPEPEPERPLPPRAAAEPVDQPTVAFEAADLHDAQRRPDPAPPVEPPPAKPKRGDEDEDVLEDTPEFLQETPEHDRLWFEQRPPRDFDFDG